MNKRGSIPLFVAGTLPIAIVAGVFAIDAGRVWLAQARLQTALDAAALTAARDINSANAKANAEAVLAANFNGGAPGQNDTGWGNVSVNPSADGNSVEVSASVSVDPLLNRIVGIAGGSLGFGRTMDANSPALKPRVITRAATANRATTGLELSLVFDVTLSMTARDVDPNGSKGRSRIEAIRDAGLQLLQILYADQPIAAGQPDTNKKWLENLFISVVPFATAVNYGSANTHLLGPADPSKPYSQSWTGAATSWGGCTEIRSLSLTDANPTNGGTGLTRYYAPSRYDTTQTLSAGRCKAKAAYSNGVCMTHNDWTAPQSLYNAKENTLIQSMVNWQSHKDAGINVWAVAHGPNMMCPPDTGDRLNNLRVLPLTRDRSTVEARIKYLTNLPFSAGTNMVPGLMAGWFTLSPNWRQCPGSTDGKCWPSAEPVVTDPQDVRPALPALPFDYFAPNRRKVLILLTDGDNNWMDAASFQGTGDTLVRPESVKTEGFYSSYGYLGGQLRATSLSDGITKINQEVVNWCQAIRATQPATKPTDPPGPEQITVYAITFSGSPTQTAKTMLSNCASTGKDGTKLYFHAPDAATLALIFQAIGAELSNLRLTQ